MNHCRCGGAGHHGWTLDHETRLWVCGGCHLPSRATLEMKDLI